MGCTGGDREKGPPEHTQKWSFITLSDFRATSSWTSIAYIWLWLMAIVAVAVYAVDTLTAVNLLAFNRWSSQIQPSIPLKYSKWIFAACIMLSWALAIYEWIRAVRVMRREGVAESYMDPLANTLQSMRPLGWRRFLVFSELTKSKKGTDYVAFFVYFAFNGAIRVILAEGPRQFVNAVTLYAVMQADLIPGANAQHSAVEQFFLNVRNLAQKDSQTAVILFSMLFTLVIWVFSALSLIAAVVLYLVFLWHYIPQRDGRLSVYCRRKIDKRLAKIVEHKVKAAMEEEERIRQKAEKKAELKRQKTGELAPPAPPKLGRQPTLPQIGSPETLQKENEAKMDSSFGLARQDTSTTVSTLPRYESRPPTRQGMQRQATLPDIGAAAAMAGERPGMPSRMGTQGSAWSSAPSYRTAATERPGMPERMGTQGSAWSSAPSYESDGAPLLSNAGYAGGRASPAPTMPPPAAAAFGRQDSNASFGRPTPGAFDRQGSNASFDRRPVAPIRSMTPGSQRSYTPMSRMESNGSMQQQQQPPRAFTPMSAQGSQYSRPPPEPRGPPMRSNTGFSFDDQPRSAIAPTPPPDVYGSRPMGPPPRQNTAPMTRQDSQASTFSRPMYGSLHSHQSSFSRPMARPTPPPPEQEGYELTAQPSYASLNYTPASAPTPAPATDGYVAFNPSFQPTTTPTPQEHAGPRRNITVAGQPGAANNYFGQVHEVPQRSATAPLQVPEQNDNRLTTGYADILDAYGSSARSSISPPVASPEEYASGQQGIRRPEPPYSGIPRSHTAEPIAGQGRGYENNRF